MGAALGSSPGVFTAVGLTVDTELPPSAALGDATANPTVPGVGAFVEGFNGAAWDRLKVITVPTGVGLVGTGMLPIVPTLYDFSSHPPIKSARQGGDNDQGSSQQMASLALLNGTNWDRMRNNIESTLLVSAARTASTASADQTNYNARGMLLLLNVTANPGGIETLTPQVQMKDPVSGVYFDISAFAASAPNANQAYAYVFYPGAVATLAVTRLAVEGLILPRTWRVNVTHSAAGSWTYSVGASVIL